MNADLETLQESNKSELERRGSIFNIGAPATEAVTIRDHIVVGFGDGSVRFFQSGSDPKTFALYSLEFTLTTISSASAIT